MITGFGPSGGCAPAVRLLLAATTLLLVVVSGEGNPTTPDVGIYQVEQDEPPPPQEQPKLATDGAGARSGSRGGGTPRATSDVLLNSSKQQLQSKFKHAADFGATGNYSKANAARFSAALNQHISSSSVSRIAGRYRGNPVTHYLDRSTGLNGIVDPVHSSVDGGSD